MEVKNLKILTCPFEEYLALPGWSHSAVRNNGAPVKITTPKMMLGKDVDNYLTDPEHYHHDNVDLVRPLAIAIKQRIGPLYKYLKPQMSFTCEFHHEGFKLLYKGRADLGLEKKFIIDIKVSEMPLSKSIPYFNYDNQVAGYCLAFGVPVGLIFSISPKTKIIADANLDLTNGFEFWKYQTVQKGEPVI